MSSGLVTKTVGDGNSGTFVATFLSSDGTGTGHLTPTPTLYDSSGNEISFATGTAGSPAGGVSTVQGQAGMTPLTTQLAATSSFVSGAITAAMTGTTSTSLLAAPGANLHNYITTIIVSCAHATQGTDIIIQDGSGGTTLLTIPAAAAYGGAAITLPTPLRQPTTNTALYCANVTTGSSTKVSVVGYTGA